MRRRTISYAAQTEGEANGKDELFMEVTLEVHEDAAIDSGGFEVKVTF